MLCRTNFILIYFTLEYFDSRMDQVKSVEDNLSQIWSGIFCLSKFFKGSPKLLGSFLNTLSHKCTVCTTNSANILDSLLICKKSPSVLGKSWELEFPHWWKRCFTPQRLRLINVMRVYFQYSLSTIHPYF